MTTGRRLTVIVPLFASYKGWLGGVHYVQNVLETLTLLPAGRRPSIYVFDDTPGDWPAALADACGHAGVRAVIGPAGRIVATADDAERSRLDACPPAELRRTVALSSDAILPMPMAESRMVSAPRHWAWIPDFQHRHLPGLFTPEDLSARDAVCRGFAERDGPLLLSSRSALDDFRSAYPDHRATPYVWSFASTLTIEGTVDPSLLARHHLPPLYLYLPNQFWVHKDHRSAFEAVRLLRDRGIAITLVCTGAGADYRNPDHHASLFRTVAEAGLSDRILHLGLVPRDEQIALIRGCAAVLQPSLFEGWSTVVEDARAIGRPLIVSDLAVHHEQLGADGHFFKAGDSDDLARVIAERLPHLAPGPDPARERIAALATRDRRLRCAETLLACLEAEAERRERSCA